MPVWRAEPVWRQPELTLQPWRVQELPDGERYLVGYCLENFEGRVSTPVVRFDPASRRAETRSGRIYRLEGPPGRHPDAEYVWLLWLAANALTEARDVSDEVHGAIRAQGGENGQTDS